MKFYCEYIYLDTNERRRFAQVAHEYLIEQVQFLSANIDNNAGSVGNTIPLNFNHPVKEIIFSPEWGRNNNIKASFPNTAIDGVTNNSGVAVPTVRKIVVQDGCQV